MKLVGRKMSRRISIAVALPLFFLGSSEAKSTPANTLRELYTALGECVKVTGGLPGSEITVVFSLKRDGSLLGRRDSSRQIIRQLKRSKGLCGERPRGIRQMPAPQHH